MNDERNSVIFTGAVFWVIIVAAVLTGPGLYRDASGQTLSPGDSLTIKCANCPPPPVCPECPVCPTPAPTPVPTPKPAPAPDICPSGGSVVTIGALQTALNAVQPNGTICVLDGIWKGPLKIDKPVRLMAATGAAPVIEPGQSDDGKVWIYPSAKGTVIEGFEIRNGYEGIKSFASDVIIRNNHIHHNKYGNVIISTESQPVNNVTLQGNRMAWPGYEKDDKPYPRISNKNAHNIYFSDYTCRGITNIYVIQNTLTDSGGRAIQGNTESCGSTGKIDGGIFARNVIERSSLGIISWVNVRNIIMRENVISTYGYPTTNDSDHFCFSFYRSEGNTVENNICKVSTLGNAGGGCGNNHYGTWSNTYRNNSCTR